MTITQMLLVSAVPAVLLVVLLAPFVRYGRSRSQELPVVPVCGPSRQMELTGYRPATDREWQQIDAIRHDLRQERAEIARAWSKIAEARQDITRRELELDRLEAVQPVPAEWPVSSRFDYLEVRRD